MIEIGPARESDVVLAFLKAEIDYSDHRLGIQQFLQTLRVTEQELLDDSSLDNDYYNAVRAVVFDCYQVT